MSAERERDVNVKVSERASSGAGVARLLRTVVSAITFITNALPAITTSACLRACLGIVEPRGHMKRSAATSSANPSTAL